MSGGDVRTAAAELEAFCQRQRWPSRFIGGIAVQRWAIPRFTQDVDLTVFTGYGDEIHILDPEDLTVLKIFAGRDRDWSDVEGVLIRQDGQLNSQQVRTDAAALLKMKDDTRSLDRLDRMIQTVQKRLAPDA